MHHRRSFWKRAVKRTKMRKSSSQTCTAISNCNIARFGEGPAMVTTVIACMVAVGEGTIGVGECETGLTPSSWSICPCVKILDPDGDLCWIWLILLCEMPDTSNYPCLNTAIDLWFHVNCRYLKSSIFSITVVQIGYIWIYIRKHFWGTTIVWFRGWCFQQLFCVIFLPLQSVLCP